MAIPDFLGIGAQKAGTTWLASNLGKHPDIWIPPLTATHYFNERELNPGVEFPDLFDRTLPYGSTRFFRVTELLRDRWPEVMADGELAKWYLKWLFQKRTDEWYFSLFDFPHHARMAGEITPSYSLLSEQTIAAIKSMNPEMKIIFSIRNPIYRCWSHVAMEFNQFRPVSLCQAPEKEIVNFIKTENVIGRNDYVGIAGKWKKVFDDNHFFMFFFEQIARDPDALMRDICRFLEVASFPSDLCGDFGDKINVGSYTDFPLKYKKLIAELTIDKIRGCAEAFGGDAVSWRKEAEALLS